MSKTIIAVVDDMFFASKIRAVAEALDVSVNFVRSQDALLAKLEDSRAALVIVDLHNRNLDVVSLSQRTKASGKEVVLVGFFSHVETELQHAAIASGFDRVIPRSVFAKELGEILRG